SRKTSEPLLAPGKPTDLASVYRSTISSAVPVPTISTTAPTAKSTIVQNSPRVKRTSGSLLSTAAGCITSRGTLALNPNSARGWLVSGILRAWAGQPDIAIEHVEAALRLSPRALVGTSLNVIGQAHFLSRRFDEAVPKLLLAIPRGSELPEPVS